PCAAAVPTAPWAPPPRYRPDRGRGPPTNCRTGMPPPGRAGDGANPACGGRPAWRRLAQQVAQRGQVFFLGALDHVGGQAGGGGRRVPGGGEQVMADELLIVARRRLVEGVALDGPVAGGVGGEHRVDEGDFARDIGAEFELGVREDHARGGGPLVTELVQGEADGLDAFVNLWADQGDALLVGDGRIVLAL